MSEADREREKSMPKSGGLREPGMLGASLAFYCGLSERDLARGGAGGGGGRARWPVGHSRSK